MSTSESGPETGEAGTEEREDDAQVNREVAWRVFAREYNDSDLSFKEGDDERAPNYVVTPTGAKINRVFVVGVVTEVDNIGDDGDLYRVRLTDPTGAFVVYAGQYQPDAMSLFADLEPPEFVAVVGKARTYEPDDSDEIYTSVRPEEVNTVDSETRDRWCVETARQTLRRVEAVSGYLEDGTADLETTPPLHDLNETVDHYGVDSDYLEELRGSCLEVLRDLSGAEETPRSEATQEAPDLDTGTDTEPSDATGTEEEVEGTKTPQHAEDDETDDLVDEFEEEFGESEESTDEGTEEFQPDEFEDIDSEEVDETEWEWDEGQREEVEEEFGAEFETASEMEPETEEGEREGGSTGAEAEGVSGDEEEDETRDHESEPPRDDAGSDTEAADDTDADAGGETDEEADRNPQNVVMDIIEDGGDDGVEREEIISTAADEGIDEETAEETLEKLLLEGMCYPTDGDRIKPL